ncbi:MAG: 4-(cytidine 5'-diphospho)-2-C-methyl-D-erythritol kinase [Spirochaetes bacterium]|nr:4-(cytidine 5'-diphospho)-2-C-methyl-D-erythritol kinase [Spirochaetota bacterium]
MKEKAFAKLNLHLQVIGKRPDSYHNIESLMVSSSFCDELVFSSFEKRKKDDGFLDLEVVGPYKWVLDDVPLKDNLVCKAFELFFENVSFSAFVKLRLVKNIPAGAGLAGGSSDAAAMLRALNKVFCCYSFKKLQRKAAQVGADVPFCLQKKAAFCTGVGNLIKPVQLNLGRIIVLIVFNKFHIDTKDAYQYVEIVKSIGNSANVLLSGLAKKDFKKFLNSFENYAVSCYPEIANTKKILYENGALYSLMTGSGSSVFGLFESSESVLKVQKVLKLQGIESVASYLI